MFSRRALPYCKGSETRRIVMKWKIGQTVVCDRHGTKLADCYVRTIDIHENAIIFCPSMNTVICGHRQALEQLGWRIK